MSKGPEVPLGGPPEGVMIVHAVLFIVVVIVGFLLVTSL